MRGKEAKRLYKIAVANGLTSREFRRLKRTLQHEHLHERMPAVAFSQRPKKMHKNEGLIQFKYRRKITNARRRLRELELKTVGKLPICKNCGERGLHYVPKRGRAQSDFYICGQKKVA